MSLDRDKVDVMTTLASYHLERARMALHMAQRLVGGSGPFDPVKIGGVLHETAKHAGTARVVARLVGDSEQVSGANDLLDLVDRIQEGFSNGMPRPSVSPHDLVASGTLIGDLPAIRCRRCNAYFLPSAGKCPTCRLHLSPPLRTTPRDP